MKIKSFLACLIIALTLISKTNAKGGGGRGGGGRGGGGRGSGSRSSSGGSRWSFFGGGSKSGTKSNGGESVYSGTSIQHSSGPSNSGGLFQGFMASRPYHFSYSPIHIGGNHYGSNTHHRSSYSDDQERYSIKSDHEHTTNIPDYSNKDETEYAIGYTISKALSNDFFSIFNVVHDISKYLEKIKNKEFLTTTSTTTTTTTEVPEDITSQPDDNTDYFKILEKTGISEATGNELPRFDDSNSQRSIFDSNKISSTDFLGQPDDLFYFLKDLDNFNVFPKTESEELKNVNSNSQPSSYDINTSPTNLNALDDFLKMSSDYLKTLENLAVPETKEIKISQNE